MLSPRQMKYLSLLCVTAAGCSPEIGRQQGKLRHDTAADASAADWPAAHLDDSLSALGIIGRAQWGARAPSCSYADPTKSRITVHHTAEDPGADDFVAMMQRVQNYHMDNNGWCDIGYHFLVTVDGRIWEARELSDLGTHVADQNGNNIGIVLGGCFDDDPWCDDKLLREPTPAMLRSVARLAGVLAEHYDIPISSSTLKGHRDYGGTVCPGGYTYSQLEEVRQLTQAPLACSPIPAEGGIIDESGPCFRREGNPGAFRWMSEGHDDSATWTGAGASSDSQGIWEILLSSAGDYTLEAHVAAGAATSTTAAYALHHSGQLDSIEIDQSAGGWIELGTFAFSAAGDQWLGLDAAESAPSERLVFDAIRLSKSGESRLDAGLTGSADPGVKSSLVGGCALASPIGGPSTLPALVGLLLWRLRRRLGAR